jgi:hypothetical protein
LKWDIGPLLSYEIRPHYCNIWVGLLDEEEKDEMERLVVKMEMEPRILQWDPGEYTLAYHQKMKDEKEEEE